MAKARTLTAEFEATSRQRLPKDQELRKLQELVSALIQMQAQVEILEGQIKQQKEQARKLSEMDIPSFMHEIGVTSLRLTDGSKISVEPFYTGKLPKDETQRAQALAYLRKHEAEDLIKHMFTLEFGAGQEKAAQRLQSMLDKDGYAYKDKEDVHHMTLKAWIREQVEAGTKIPLDLFDAYIGEQTKVTK